ncbi:MAG: SGNH/GDSL hydrolase family protein [Lachnospiraceae bacterium]|nr:SGNH/GDSL hydrolase family protein [Lachnospiraceae bacterium]
MPKYIHENQDGRITQEYYPVCKDTDVIFVGSSTVHSGIDPRILKSEQGISAYLRANASQPMWITYYMIEDALRWHTPELVCIDTTFIKYGDDFVEEPSTRKALDGMRMSPSKINAIRASMGEDEKMADYIMPLFRFHSRWKELTLDDFRYAYYNKPVTVNGFLPDEEVEPAVPGDLVYTREGDTTLSSRNVEYLRKAIELCKSKGIQVMVFKTPAHSENWSRDYDDQINEIVKEYNLSYINFDDKNDEIGLDYSTDTPDGGSHLNTSGAAKFTKYLGEYIRNNFTVSDRR